MRSILMKEKQPELMKKEVPRIVWYLICPICKKEISGNYKDQAYRNLKNHMDKHKKEDKK